MTLAAAAAALRDGKSDAVTVRPHGNSMTPRIASGQQITIRACVPGDIAVGDVVLCTVRGVVRLHLVTAIDSQKLRAQISNNHGYVNGWTGFARIYGKAEV